MGSVTDSRSTPPASMVAGRHAFVADVKPAQPLAGIAEDPEVGNAIRARNPRDALREVVPESLAVVLGVQQSLDVMEDSLAANGLARVRLAEMGEIFFSDGISPNKAGIGFPGFEDIALSERCGKAASEHAGAFLGGSVGFAT